MALISAREQTEPARTAYLEKTARRSVDDPVALAKAARIVRAALERGALTKADLDGPIVPQSTADTS
jgi:hypothetical protein